MSDETIKVYWAPDAFVDPFNQWNMAYTEPKPLSDGFYSGLSDDPIIVRCPATRESVRNIFSINSNIDEFVEFDKQLLLDLYSDKTENERVLPIDSKISFFRFRPSSYEGFVNINYNMSWIFLADRPLVMRTTPPMFPVSTPTKNSILAFGKFDIGRWFRPIVLDYHIPLDAKTFIIDQNQPLISLEFETEKKIEFVRFKNTEYIKNISQEFSQSSVRWGKRMTLEKRYKMAEKANLVNIAMSEVKKNVIEL